MSGNIIYFHKYDNLTLDVVDKDVVHFFNILKVWGYHIGITHIWGGGQGSHHKRDGIFKAVDFCIYETNKYKNIVYDYLSLKTILELARMKKFDFRIGFYNYKIIHLDNHKRNFRPVRTWYGKRNYTTNKNIYYYPYIPKLHKNYKYTYDIENDPFTMLEYLHEKGIII